MASPFLRSFAAGEIAPSMRARVDQVKYQTGLAICRNWFTRLEGGAVNRSGSKFVCPLVLFSTSEARQIPFIFNDDQSYSLLIHYDGALYVQFLVLKDGFPVTTGTPKVIEGVTKANPAVVTATAHGLTGGSMVYIEDVRGMTQLNGRFFQVKNPTANTFELWEEVGVDSTTYDAFIAGPGTASLLYSKALSFVTEDMIRGLRYAQNADVLTLTNNQIPIIDITRIADNDWQVEYPVMEPDIAAPGGGSASGNPAGSEDVRYRITAVDSDTLEESFPYVTIPTLQISGVVASPVSVRTSEPHGFTTGDEVFLSETPAPFQSYGNRIYIVTVVDVDDFTLNGTSSGVTSAAAYAGFCHINAVLAASITFPSASDPVTLTWDAVPGALEYNVYREINGIYGYIGTAAGTTLEDDGLPVDAFDTPPVPQDFFAVAGDFPNAVGYHQQRKLYGGTTHDPEGVRASRSGLFRNFTKSNPIQADDAIRFTIAASQVNEVRYFLEMGRLLVFTQGAVFTIEGDEAGTLTPTAINPRLRAQHGVGSVEPIPIGNGVVYVQTSGKIVREIIPGTGDDFPTRDLTVYSKHLFRRFGLVSWSYAEEPYSIVWGVRSDGTMVGLTYLRDHEILGWHRHDTGDGDEFLDVCCIPENNETAIYVLVRRYDCNGKTRVYCERFATREVDTAIDGRFLDSFVEYDGRNTDAGNTYELSFDTTHEATADWWIAPTGGTSPFAEGVDSADIGNTIVLHVDGEEVRCTITDIYSQFAARVSIEGDTSGLTLPYETSSWDYAVDEMTGLWHLEGREVYAMGDGEKLGPFTVEGGEVDVGTTCSVLVIGLQIIADLKTLPIDTAEAETLADKRKHVGKTTLLVEDTKGLQVGVTEADLQPWDPEWAREWDQDASDLYTGNLSVTCGGKTDDDGHVFIRQSDPLPATVLGIIPTVRVGRA